MATFILVVVLLIYFLSYFKYGRWLERSVIIAKPENPTPAHQFKDGIDYVPTNRFVLFGHHFSSIAGAAPIVGPVIGMAWGWLPALIWIIFGNVFMGAVHDYITLMASVRHKGYSIEWVSSRIISKTTGTVFGIFVFLVLLLVIAAFCNIQAELFTKQPEVATASLLFILIAVIFGFLFYRFKMNLYVSTIIGLLLMIVAIVVSNIIPIRFSYNSWIVILFFYIIIAAALPVNLLLQPRDYLNAWLLWIGLILGTISIIVGRFNFNFPLVTSFTAPVISDIDSPFWPVIPLIIACGSLSGFHCLVASGTTSKQLDKEIDGLFIGYGGMLTEGFLSTIVILVVASFGLEVVERLVITDPKFASHYLYSIKEVGGPVGFFANCYGRAVYNSLGLPLKTVTVLAALWVSCFVMTTLDTANRIARYTFEELIEPFKEKVFLLYKVLSFRWISGMLPALIGILLAWSGKYQLLWPAFGGANQLLACIGLITGAIWVLKYLNHKAGGISILIPVGILWPTVTSALLWFLIKIVPLNLPGALGITLGIIISLMIILNFVLLISFINRLREGS